MSRSRRRILEEAKRERRRLDAWVKAGRPGERPPTPSITKLTHEYRKDKP